ncbi:hypothetical protein GCM10023350_21900 [Nocardioides endophyticus]|uniref:Winged helix DNA-binding domain-containing protein n=1 Tax=Nocardioides endophyticus TaxID=1353775 RepID=A0ABP8YTU0_9ACTN
MLTSLASGRAAGADLTQQIALRHALLSLDVAFVSDEVAAGGPPSVHLALTKSHIVRHLGQPDLTPTQVAQGAGSRRATCTGSLRAMAKPSPGTSANGEVVLALADRQRLQGARRDIVTSLRDQPIKEIAGRWGIPNPRHDEGRGALWRLFTVEQFGAPFGAHRGARNSGLLTVAGDGSRLDPDRPAAWLA